MYSAGLAPPGGPPGGPGGVGAPPPGSPSGGGGGQVVAFADSQEFVEQHPEIANASERQREAWRREVPTVLARIVQFARDEQERQRVVKELAQQELAPDTAGAHRREQETMRVGTVLATQVAEAQDAGVLDTDLLSDALGVATWAIGMEVGESPSPASVALLDDPRLRFIINYYAPLYV